MVALLPAGGAEPPAPGGQPKPVEVEIYHGSHRVVQKKEKQEDSHPPKSAPEIVTANRSDHSGVAPLWPAVSGQGLPFVRWPATGLFGVQNIVVSRPPLPAPSEPPAVTVENPGSAGPEIVKGNKAASRRASEATRKAAKTQQASDLSEDEDEPAASPVGRGRPRPSPADHAAEPTDNLNKTLIQVAFIFAVAIVAPVVSIVCFFGLLRRHSKRFGPLFRIDYVGNQPVVTGPFTVGALGAGQQIPDGGRFQDLQAPAAAAEPAAEPEHTPERFDLGPTFEDERLLKEAQAKQQEEAVLQHLLEENLRLQEQIEQGAETKEEL
jgi:hypothetical protein